VRVKVTDSGDNRFRMMDALGCASLKTSVLEQEIFTYDDAK
jgi:hypothetical protein